MLEVTAAAFVGAVAGLLLVLLFDRSYGQISDSDALYFVVAGALAGVAIKRGMR